MNRRTTFRISAVVLALVFLLGIEGTCRLILHRSSTAASDSFVEYLGRRPLFTRNDANKQYEIAENRRAYFAQDSFSADLSGSAKRIFVLGGSTVQGRPYSVPTSFPTCMEAGLLAAVPEQNWEVINCGGVSYASYRLIPVLEEVLTYDPAAIVLCTGHNEFLEFMTYQDAVQAVDTFGESAVALSGLASVQLIKRLFLESSEPNNAPKSSSTTALPNEVDALLDQPDGWSLYRRQDLQPERIRIQFERNLRHMVNLCEQNKVPVMIVAPPFNLADCPPFKSEFSAGFSNEQQKQYLQSLSEAAGESAGSAARKIGRLTQLCKQQSEYALAWYQLGRALMEANRTLEAEKAFQRALDEDVCPLRMTSELAEVLNQVSGEMEVRFVDLQLFLKSQSRLRVVGDEFLVDHVHPSFSANRKIGCLLADELLQILRIRVQNEGWKQFAVEKLKADFEDLDSMYFLRGRRALDNLNGWARGRAHGSPLGEP